ncbi:MAG: hypothetical protein DCF19_07365 [Pseudanabaena frigida]|uniref:Restriction endonuclease domain-containing protein n=1 Tax=Pseudanabaena frigida TaxID=945775 RepID=A0A2W4WKI2_9CYAN|nr:MAG: hypothetical protein DCF19_07365 [Pseudanabaena frigida]
MTFTVITEKVIGQSESLNNLTLEAFLNLLEIDESFELISGEAIKKMSPKFFNSRLTSAIWAELLGWASSNCTPETYRGDRGLTDELFPNLSMTSEQFFIKAGI